MLEPGQPIEFDHTIVPEATFKGICMEEVAAEDISSVKNAVRAESTVMELRKGGYIVKAINLQAWQVERIKTLQSRHIIVGPYHRKIGEGWATSVEPVFYVFEVEPLGDTNG